MASKQPCATPVPREPFLQGLWAVQRGPAELQLSVPFLPLQVTLLGFAGTLEWQIQQGAGMLITLPYMLPSPLPPQSGWVAKLEGVK